MMQKLYDAIKVEQFLLNIPLLYCVLYLHNIPLLYCVLLLTGAHYKHVPNSEELPESILDVLCKSVSVNSSYATRVMVSIGLSWSVCNCCFQLFCNS